MGHARRVHRASQNKGCQKLQMMKNQPPRICGGDVTSRNQVTNFVIRPAGGRHLL
jgi:hypothetical protein